MITQRFKQLLVLATAALAASCTVSSTPAPPLAGPSEMSLSLTITANPDVLSLDGASQSQVVIEARDSNGQPAANIPLRVEIVADGQAVDFGTISARTLVTNNQGRATFTYTAPLSITGEIPTLSLSVTPTGTDAAAHIRRSITIRLVPPGVITIGPTPRFTFLPTTPAAFTDVRFDGSTSTAGLGASLVRYVWDFGDNTSATGVTVSHQYDVSRTYYATLTVTDSNGLSAQSASQAIQVGSGSAPMADFVFSPLSPSVGQSIFFNGTSSTGGQGHRIVRYDWDFGTGSTRSGSIVSKSYETAGTYNVVLTVTDEVGQTSQSTKPVNVASTGGGEPTAAIDFSPTAPSVSQPVFYNAGGSTTPVGTTITTYAWDFGDGTAPGTGATPSHTYSAAATYVVRLTITNSAGQTATTTKPVPVTAGGSALSADFTFSPTNPTSGGLVNFNANTSSPLPSINQFDWDFGDGTSQVVTGVNNTTINHSYTTTTTETTYTVRLTVHDTSGRTATTTEPVTVATGTAPIARFTISPSPAPVNAVVTLDGASSTGATRYTWDFGDGTAIVSTNSPTTSITHQYSTAKTYTITLTVTDSVGQTGSTSHTLLVQ